SSPAFAVGAAVIDLTPRPVKEFAIRTFGQNDKHVLLTGVFVVLALFAAAVGVAARRRPVFGTAGIVLFGVIGVVSAITRPAAGTLDSAPSIVGAGAGVLALSALINALNGRTRQGGSVEFSRRRFLVTGGVLLGAAAIGGGIGRALTSRFDVSKARAALRLPKPASPAPARIASLNVPDITPFYTDARDFYRVDTALVIPQIKPADYRLRIHGRVSKPLTLSLEDLLGRGDLIERDITIACVSNEVGGNLAGNARWLGVPLKSLLDEAGPAGDADQIVGTSADGWTCGTPTAICRDGRDALLAVAMNGDPLPVEHGFPVRMIVPGLYGYVSATKWLVDLELSRFTDFDAYWVRRGWTQQANIKTFSRIDTPKPFGRPRSGDVVVAGVAWAQHRGIEKVEVRVDGGPWGQAELAPAGSTVDTWRQWSWHWKATSGQHTLECRATDGGGITQTSDRADPFPDGATGWHSVVVTAG
ncbi:MAG: hypothetical protein QOI35_1607, partial [Cryptosporangiaceae bacterium]|nr:hypothetical protein [Cryptosporangiaceae bacterium]